jgi:hypothetical protein
VKDVDWLVPSENPWTMNGSSKTKEKKRKEKKRKVL